MRREKEEEKKKCEEKMRTEMPSHEEEYVKSMCILYDII